MCHSRYSITRIKLLWLLTEHRLIRLAIRLHAREYYTVTGISLKPMKRLLTGISMVISILSTISKKRYTIRWNLLCSHGTSTWRLIWVVWPFKLIMRAKIYMCWKKYLVEQRTKKITPLNSPIRFLKNIRQRNILEESW